MQTQPHRHQNPKAKTLVSNTHTHTHRQTHTHTHTHKQTLNPKPRTDTCMPRSALDPTLYPMYPYALDCEPWTRARSVFQPSSLLDYHLMEVFPTNPHILKPKPLPCAAKSPALHPSFRNSGQIQRLLVRSETCNAKS